MRYIAIDTETYLVSAGRLVPKMVCLTIAEDTKGRGIVGRILAGDAACKWFRKAVKDPRIILVGHRMNYDMAVMAQAADCLPEVFAAYAAGRVRCTLIRESLTKIALGHFQKDPDSNGGPARLSLAKLAWNRLQIEMTGKADAAAWRFRYQELDGVPLNQWPEEATRYAVDDAKLTLRVYHSQKGDLADARSMFDEVTTFEEDFWPDERWQTEAAWALHLLNVAGMHYSPERVAQLEEEHRADIARVKSEVHYLGVYKDDGRLDTKRLRELITLAFAEQGREPPRTAPSSKFKEGQVQYADDVLIDSGNPDLVKIGRAKSDQGELNKYLKHMHQEVNGVERPIVQCYIQPCIATGRTSFASPPIQQMPRREGVRDCFEAPEGYVFIGADYNACELVALAQIQLDEFGESELADVLIAGRDPHLTVAAAMLGIDYEDAEYLRDEGDDDDRKTVKRYRGASKPLNFGAPTGMAAGTLQLGAKKSYGIVEDLEFWDVNLELWHATYPIMRRYMNWAKKQIREAGGGTVYVIQPRSGRIRGVPDDRQYTTINNTRFQGLSGDMSKRALVMVVRECYLDKSSALYGSRPCLLMHDEIMAYSPEAKAGAAAARLAEIMVEEGAKLCPDVPVLAEPYMSYRWQKSAETLRSMTGRLRVWESYSVDCKVPDAAKKLIDRAVRASEGKRRTYEGVTLTVSDQGRGHLSITNIEVK